MPPGPLVDRRAGLASTVLLWALPAAKGVRHGVRDGSSLLLVGQKAPLDRGGGAAAAPKAPRVAMAIAGHQSRTTWHAPTMA